MKTECSVAILTLNNEDTIQECLESVAFCDDVVVLDGSSSDKTVEIAEKLGARVYPQFEGNEKNKKIENFTEMREKSFRYAKHDWIFYVDSDEYLSSELQNEIKKIVEEDNIFVCGSFNRIAIIEKKKIKYAFHYPNWSDRLINKKSGIHWKLGPEVHEKFEFPEGVIKKKLKGELFSYWPSYEQCKKKYFHYYQIGIEKMKRNRENVKWTGFLKGLFLNTLRAFKVFFLSILLPIKHKKGVMPFKYHWLYVLYNFRHAWSFQKWKMMFISSWKKLPKSLRIILFFGLLFRLLFFGAMIFEHGQSQFSGSTNNDSVEYVAIAQNLIHNRHFSVDKSEPFNPNNYRAPGYPIFLILFGAGNQILWIAVVAQIIVSLILAILVYNLANRMFGHLTAIISAGFACFEPNMIFWPNQLITETLFSTFLFTSIYFFVIWIKKQIRKKYIISLFFLALATYIRQVSYQLIYVIPVFASVVVYLKNREKVEIKKIILVFLTGLFVPFLILSPWFIRNKIVFNEFSYGSLFAVRGSIGKYLDSYTLVRFGELASEHYEYSIYDAEKSNEIASFIIKKTAQTFVSDPIPYFQAFVASAIPFFMSDGWFTIAKTYNPEFSIASFDKSWYGSISGLFELSKKYIDSGGTLFLFAKCVYGIIAFLFFIGFAIAYKNEKKFRMEIATLGIIVLYFVVGSGVASYSRFRYPVQSIIFIFSSFSIALIYKEFKERYAR